MKLKLYTRRDRLAVYRKLLFGFKSHQHSMFHQNPQLLCDDIRNSVYSKYPLHEPYYDTDTII